MKLYKTISTELIKTIYYNGFWIIIAMTLALFIFISAFVPFFDIQLFGSALDLKSYYKFPLIWKTTTWLSSFFIHLLSLLTIILVTNDYNFNTFKQSIITGLSRTEIIISKIFLILFISTLYTLVVTIITLIYGFGFTESENYRLIFDNYSNVLLLFLQTFGLLSFALFIAFFLKSTAVSVIVYIAYYIFENFLSFIFFVNQKDFSKYFPLEAMSNLNPNPSLTTALSDPLLKEQITETADTTSIVFFLAISISYILFFLTLVFFKSKRQNY